jgi:23S rRNA (adenosine1067-2'-O)-methyltransferase
MAGIITLRQFPSETALKTLDFNVTLGFIFRCMNEKSLAYSDQLSRHKPAVNASHLVGTQADHGIVDSLLHPLAILIRQVLTRSGRMELNLILIDDEENILEALDAGIGFHSIYYSQENISSELVGKLPANVKIYRVTRRTCKKLFENDKVARVFAIAHTPAMPGLDSLLETQRDIVVLEDLTISGNVGAIVRTSLAFGAGGIVLLNAEPVDVFDRRTIRASRGYIFSLPMITATTEEFIRFCRANDLSILVMTARAKEPVPKATAIPRQLAIVFGSEKSGSSQRLLDAARLQVQIPTNSKVESLNVSTAAGIMLYNRLWFNHLPAGKRADL